MSLHPDLGTIRVCVGRISGLEKRFNELMPPLTLDASSGVVHEKAKKLGGHYIA